MITTKDVVEALSTEIGSMCPDFHIYTFNPDQNVVTPCFIIQPISNLEQDLLGTPTRYMTRQRYSFSIVFLADDNWEMRYVSETVSVNLRFIELDGHTVQTLNRELKWIDETTAVIQLEIPVQVLIYEDDGRFMEELEETIKVD